VIDEPGAVAGPVELGGALEVGSWLTAEHGYRPHTDGRSLGSVGPPDPERDERPIWREAQRADRRIDELPHGTASQVVELTHADLGDPDVRLSVAIGQEGHESSVSGNLKGRFKRIRDDEHRHCR